MASNEILKVTDEFIQQNAEHAKIKKPSKSGGPYSKDDRDARREEVRRLYFDYGYSARKIAELMKVNRNTINGDVEYWYSQIVKNSDNLNPRKMARLYIEQLHSQKTRLREQLDKVTSNSERIAIERLIYDITCKTLHTFQKLADSKYTVDKKALELFNEYLIKKKFSYRYVSYPEVISASNKAVNKIFKILKDDGQNNNLRKLF